MTDPSPTRQRRQREPREHEHVWRVLGPETLGGVLFRVDMCIVRGCADRRACRIAGPAALPPPPAAPQITPHGRGDRVLWLLADRGSMGTSELSERLSLSRQAARELLGWLVTAGWLERRHRARGDSFSLSAKARKNVT